MAVSKAEKQTELAELEKAFRQADTAVLVDYRGITVPQVKRHATSISYFQKETRDGGVVVVDLALFGGSHGSYKRSI